MRMLMFRNTNQDWVLNLPRQFDSATKLWEKNKTKQNKKR